MYRSFLQQLSNENIMTFTPPGFRNEIDVQFPRHRLPVCDRCKRISKTREQCRTRDCHTDVAWCDTYVCITLDNSCTDSDGKLLDGPFVAKTVPLIPFNLKGKVNPLTPICTSCKLKNYTRTYCRQKKKHRQLPWSAVHVITSLEVNDISEKNATNTASLPISSKRSKLKSAEVIDIETNANTFSSKRKGSFSEDVGIVNEKLKDHKEFQKDQFSSRPNKKRGDRRTKVAMEISTGHGEEGKDLEKIKAVEAAKLNDIPRSRTFLVTASHREPHRVEWVDIDPALVSQLHNANRNIPGNQVSDNAYKPDSNPTDHNNASRNIREPTSVSKMNETENEGVTNAQGNMNLRSGGIDGQRIQQEGARSEGRNLTETMEPGVSNIVNTAATNIPGIGTNYAPLSGIESQMVGEQMSHLAGRMGEIETTDIANTLTSTNMWGLGSSGVTGRNAMAAMEPSVSNIVGISATNIPGIGTNYASLSGIESQMVGEQMSHLAGRMGGRMTGRNAMAAMDPSISNIVGTSATNIPGFSANYASRLGIESQMVGGQMPHLGSQNMIRYQTNVERRMRQQNQMNQYPMQVDNTYGNIPINSQQGGDRMIPLGPGTSGRGFNSVQEMMQYDLEMRQMREIFKGQIPIDGNQPMAPGMAFNTTTERSDFRTGIRGADRMAAPGGDESEVGSQMMRTSNTSSDLESGGPDVMIRDIYSGRNVRRTIVRNLGGLQDTYPQTGVGEQTVRGDDSNLAYDEGKSDGED